MNDKCLSLADDMTLLFITGNDTVTILKRKQKSCFFVFLNETITHPCFIFSYTVDNIISAYQQSIYLKMIIDNVLSSVCCQYIDK